MLGSLLTLVSHVEADLLQFDACGNSIPFPGLQTLSKFDVAPVRHRGLWIRVRTPQQQEVLLQDVGSVCLSLQDCVVVGESFLWEAAGFCRMNKSFSAQHRSVNSCSVFGDVRDKPVSGGWGKRGPGR